MNFLQVVTMFLLSMTLLANHTVAFTMNTDQQPLSHHQNSTDPECPSVWYEYNEIAHDCQCIGLIFLKCEGENTYADTRNIFTYDSTRRIISSVKMRQCGHSLEISDPY